MEPEQKKFDLRSEKIRNIIGQIPHKMVRFGIISICIFIFILCALVYSLKFEHKIIGYSELYQSSDTIYYSIRVPANELDKLNVGQDIIFLPNQYLKLPLRSFVQKIDSTFYLTKKESYIMIRGFMEDSEIVLLEKIDMRAEIYTQQMSLFELYK